MPPALLDKPDLFPDVEDTWLAFWVLNRSRPSAFGPGAIPFSDIAHYLAMFPRFDSRFFITAIQEMDSVYLAHMGKKMERESKRNKGAKQVSRSRRRR